MIPRFLLLISLTALSGCFSYQPIENWQAGLSGPVKGYTDAPVTIIEFSDFSCKYCKRQNRVLEELLQERSEEVRLIFKHLPHNKEGYRASVAAIAASLQGKFWEMHDQIYSLQNYLAERTLIEHAQLIGLDLEQFKHDLNSSRVRAVVKRDIALAESWGIEGTPWLIVNGQSFPGLTSKRALEVAIERALQ